MDKQIILHKRSGESGKIPTPNDIEYGEIAMNYASDTESLFFKNSSNEIVTIKDKKYIDNAVQNLMTDTELKFYCIEPVTISINGEELVITESGSNKRPQFGSSSSYDGGKIFIKIKFKLNFV